MPKKIIAQRSGLVLYRNIAEQFPGQRDVRMRMPDVAGPKVLVHGFRSRGQTSLCNEHRGYVRVEVVKGPGRPAAHVINAVERLRILCRGSKQVGLHDVVDRAEVPGSKAVAVDLGPFAAEQAFSPPGNHGRIRSFGVLSLAENVEIAKADGLDAE